MEEAVRGSKMQEEHNKYGAFGAAMGGQKFRKAVPMASKAKRGVA